MIIDLLAPVNLQFDVIKGVWERIGKALEVSPVDGFSRLTLSTVPLGDYEFCVRLIRKQGEDGEIVLILPVGTGEACNVYLAKAGNFGLENNAETLQEKHRPELWRNHKLHEICCRVRHFKSEVNISVTLDTNELLSWKGPRDKLVPRKDWVIPRDSLGVGAHHNTVHFELATLTMLSGTAKTLPGWTSIGWHAADEGWHDVFPLVDLSRDAVFGKWLRQKQLFGAEQMDFSRLMIPVVPLGSYEVQLEWEPICGNPEMNLLLPVGPSPFGMTSFMLSLPGGDWLGINEMGKEDRETATRAIKPDEFPLGQTSRIQVRVELQEPNVSVVLTVNDQPGIQWSGPRSKLHLRDEWRFQPTALAVGGHGDAVLFRKLAIRRISGKILRLMPLGEQ